MRLYEYTELYREALKNLEGNEDIPPEVIADTLESMQGLVEDKALSVAAYILNIEAEIIAMMEAEYRIKERRESKARRLEWLKNYLIGNLQASGLNSIESPEFCVKLRNCPESVKIIDENLIPAEFKRVISKTEIDKRAIKAANGCEGVVLEKKQTIFIR